MKILTCKTITALILFAAILIAGACKKENLPPAANSTSDNISDRTIRYTVLVVPGGNTGFKSVPAGADSAFVSLVMNDSIYNKFTDENGLVTFNNLAAGIAAVTVRYANHCTANLLVDLSAESDTIKDDNNIRNASTMVALFPYNGDGAATVSGKTMADLDLTLPGPENVPPSLQISSIIDPAQFIDYVKQTGDGKIVNIAYEHTINHVLTDANGDYALIVPATGSGLKIILVSDDFSYNQQITPGVFERKIFRCDADTIIAYSGMNYLIDKNFY